MKQEPPQTRRSRVGIPGVHAGEDVKVATVPSMADADTPAQTVAPDTETVRLPHNGIYDSLYHIAARRLGDEQRWLEIWALNKDTTMVDGRVFTNPNVIRSGWVLRLPQTPPTSAPPTGGTGAHGPSLGGGRTPSTPSTSVFVSLALAGAGEHHGHGFGVDL